MTIDEVAKETARDKTLTTVIQAIVNNKWYGVEDGINKKNISHSACQLSRTHKDSIIHKGHRRVLPKTLKKSANIAHVGHQGIAKNMTLIQQKVWFKNMQPPLEENIRNCHTYQISIHKMARKPLQMSRLPAALWEGASAHFGHL